jgi:hypothetical protein
MKNLRLLCVSAGLVGLGMATPASAVPNFDSQVLFTATAAPEVLWSERTSCGNLESSQTFLWDGTAWRNMTYPGRSTSNGATLAAEVPNGLTSVPDAGGSTAVLLLGALLSIAGLGRRLKRQTPQ